MFVEWDFVGDGVQFFLWIFESGDLFFVEWGYYFCWY